MINAYTILVGEPQGKKDRSEDKDANVSIILKWLLGNGIWILLAQDRDMWKALTNTVTDLCLNIKGGEFVD
jgi:hypothetical protein